MGERERIKAMLHLIHPMVICVSCVLVLVLVSCQQAIS